jgi:hypothetical protein
VADEKPAVQKAVELFVYAPVGAALYARDMLPSMMGIFVSRGKREVESHIPGRAPTPPTPPPVPPEVKRRIDESMGVAKYMAEGGLGVARDVAGSSLGVAREVAGSALAQFLAMRANGVPLAEDVAPTTSGVTEATTATTTAAEAPESPATPVGSVTSAASSSTAPAEAEVSWQTDVPAVESLPIPDYDELSASQVVERLEGLDRESLDAIRRYETEHRGRNTILGKIAQLG